MTAPQQRIGPAQAAGQNQKMTLRRFVRVTLDNFRQLLQTIAAPTTSLPMPTFNPPPAQPALPPPDGDAAPERSDRQPPATIVPSEPAISSAQPQPAAELGSAAHVPLEPAPVEDPGGEHAASQPEQSVSELAAFAVSSFAPDSEAAAATEVHTPPWEPGATATEAALGALDAAVMTVDAEAGAPVSEAAGESDAAPTFSAEPDAEPDDALAGVVEDGMAADTEDAEDSKDEEGAPAASSVQAAGFSLAAALESLLFVADAAVEPAQLARTLEITPAAAEAALAELDAAYRREGRGLRLQVRNGRYQLVTAPEAANLIENFLNLDASTRLSGPALETLAVAAYRQPVTRAQIEAVRGVDCSGVLRSLLQRGLLEEVGRLDAPGRPVLYGVTDLFMHHFGLTALHELPPLEDAELARIEEVGA